MTTATRTADAAREIVTSRQIGAPRELVWRVWTDPTHVTKWWGPHGFRTTTSEFNLRNGGTWRFVMHGPDGIDYPNKIVFLDIEEPNYLNYRHVGEDDFAHILFEAIVTFEPRDGGTFVTLRSIFQTAQERDYVVENHGAIEGAKNTLERFEAVVREFSARRTLELTFPSDTTSQFTRYFDAPRALVWQAWTSREHLPQWMTGPDGWTMRVIENNLHAGGSWKYVWRRTDGTEMSMHGIHREVVAPEKLVSTENWGGPWPESVNHLILTEEEGRTRMTLTVEYISREARDNATQTGMTDGMESSFSRLDDLLARR